MMSRTNPFGLGTWEDLNGLTPGDNPFGLGTWEDLNGWTPNDDTE